MATELLANPNLETWTDPQELITDPGFEDWASATDLTSWSESTGGLSTVNRDAPEFHSGQYCCRLDVDGANSFVGVNQTVAVTAGVPCTFSFYHKESGAATCGYYIRKSGGDFLQADGSWAVGAYSFLASNEAAYTQATKTFTPFFTGNVTLYILRLAATSESIYIDDASLQQTDGLITDGAVSNWTDENELLTNPTFSAWASGTDATGWTETVAGSSTVTMNGTAYHGDWCVKLSIDGADNNAQIAQGVSLTSDKSYTASFYHKESGAATAKYAITNGSADYLQVDGSWAGGVVWFETGNEAAYAIESKAFTPDETSTHTLTIKEGSNVTDETIHLDACSLQLTAGLVTDGGVETWTDANTLTNWTTATAGATSILTRSADANTGAFAASLVICATGEDVTLYQDMAVVAGKAYELTFYRKETNAATTKLRITDLAAAPDEYLQANGSWAVGSHHFTITHSAAYAQHSLKFVAHTTGNLRVEFLGEDANETYFIDDVVLKALPVLDSWVGRGASAWLSMVERELSGYLGLAVRMDVDANGREAYVYQSLGTLTSGVAYELRVWGYADGGADPTIRITNGSGDELQSDGTWVNNGNTITWTDTGWTEKVVKFIPDETSVHELSLRAATASKSYYYDTISLKPIPTPDDWTTVPSKLSTIHRDYDGQSGAAVRVDVDAAGEDAYLYQAVALTSGDTYLLTAYGKATAGADPTLSVYNGSGDELQAVGTWVNNGNVFAWADTGYTLKTIYFIPDESSNHTLLLYGVTADKSYHYDTLSLIKVDPAAYPNLLDDGKLELWTSPTGLACWTETVAGSSTVNQETDPAKVTEGSFCARFDIDGTSNAQIAQAATLAKNTQYGLSFNHMAEASATCKYAVTNASADYLQANGTWGAGAHWFEPAHTATYAAETKLFVPDEASAHTVTIKEGSAAAAKSIWIDDIRLNEVVQPGFLPKPPMPVLNPAHPMARGIVGAWLFNEGSGTQANDTSWLQNHGTLTVANGGLPEWAGSHWGHALDFNSKGYITIPTRDEYMGDELSVEMLFRVDVLPSVAGRTMYLARKAHSGAPHVAWSLIVDSAADKLTLATQSTVPTEKTVTADAAIEADRWYYVIITVDYAHVSLMYVDAVTQTDTETNDAGLYQADGAIQVSHSSTTQLDGTIAYLKIYDRALSQAEVAWLYHNPWVGVRPTRRRRRR